MQARVSGWALAVALGALAAPVLAAAAPPSAASSALWLAAGDVHLDPFGRAVAGQPGDDTDPALLASALRAMRAAVPEPAVVLLTGDFLAHHWARLVRERGGGRTAEDAAGAAMRSMAAAFGRAFPQAQFVLALGNNDAPCGDYRTDPDGRFAREAAAAWAPLVDRNGSAPGAATALASSGYYTVRLPAQHLQLIVLDTVPFSLEYRGSCGGGGSASAELAWLKATLRATPQRARNVVLMHVPPGYDAFATELTRGFVAWPYLNARDDAALVRLLDDPNDRVAFAIAGHAHRFDVRLFGRTPLIVLGSISPIYRNAPAFYRLRVERDGLDDLATYAFDGGASRWRGPHDFDRSWHVRRLDATSLQRVHARLGVDPAARAAWGALSVGWSTDIPQSLRVWQASTWRIPWCAQTFAGAAFVRCAGIERRVTATRAAIVAAGILALSGFVAAIAAVVRALRRHGTRKGSVPGPP